ncbi:MAG: phosphoribosyltransferase family protein [Microbacteriaceae bacterium]
MASGWREAALDALAVVLPVRCAGCGRADRALCGGCRAALAPRPAIEHRTPGGLLVRAAHEYGGVVRRVLLAYKEDGRTVLARELAVPLAALLAPALLAPGPVPPGPGVVIAAVPSSAAARRRRGFEPVPTLLRAAGYRSPRLLVVAPGPQQKGLGLAERARARSGAMRARRPLAGIPVLLVDDVVTTGASLDEAARAVRAAGGTVAGAVALASTPRHADGR